MKREVRSKSVGTKVSEAELRVLESRAERAGVTLSEWVRDVLLGSSVEQGTLAAERAILAEVLAMRTILLNFMLKVGEPGRYTTVSAGDGQVVSFGEWDGHLPGNVKYRLISRTVERVGETLPGPWQEDKLASTPKGYLRFRGELYHRVKDLEPSVREFLSKGSETPKQQP